jgi:thermitase
MQLQTSNWIEISHHTKWIGLGISVKRKAIFLAILLIVPFSGYASPFAWGKEMKAPMQSTEFVPNQVLIKFDEEVSLEARKNLTGRFDTEVLLEIDPIEAVVLSVPNGEVDAVIAELSQQAGVVYVEPNYYVYSTDIFPNDPGWENQYNMTSIHAPAGWLLNTGATWVTIAIVDTGVDLSHPDLFVRILPGYDFVNNDNEPQDDNGHGTHVAAIAAASTNNGEGVAGVNWGANILPIKVLNSSATGNYANVAAGIVWATDHGAQVINLSLGGSSPSFVLNDAVNYAYQRGVVLVASTGNDGSPAVLYPAAYEPVIAVGATDSGNNWAGFSNYGSDVDVVAPGVNIYSAFSGGGYEYRSGTSMSAPHVSGLAALLWGIPGNGPARIRTLIETNTLDLGPPGWDDYYGFGLIQMDAAIQQALPTATPLPTSTTLPSITPEPTQTVVLRQDLAPRTHIVSFTVASMPTEFQTPSSFLPASQTPVYGTSDVLQSETPEVAAITPTIQATVQTKNRNNWVGCAGAGLIVLGIILFWLETKKIRMRLRKW